MALGCVTVMDKHIVACTKCQNLISLGKHNVRRHIITCIGYAVSLKVVERFLESHELEDNEYESVVDLASHPETHQALLSGSIHTRPMLACPTAGCLAAFPPGDREPLVTHMKGYHAKARGSRDTTLFDIAKSAPLTVTMCFGRSHFVRVIDSRDIPTQDLWVFRRRPFG
jgi:hypothetical protein